MGVINKKRIIGIDPGIGGFVTCLIVDTNARRTIIKETEFIQMPSYRQGKAFVVDSGALTELFKKFNPDLIVIEEVHSMPKDGKAGAFSFGRSFQAPISIACALGYSIKLVTPQAWQKQLFGAKRKDIVKPSVAWCKQMFPSVDWKRTPRCLSADNNKTDSMCLAYYGALTSNWV